MTKAEKATRQMEEWARDDTHGYDQASRWGPDYDCSSSTIQAWENAGVPVKSAGASSTWNMYDIFIANGFEDVTTSVDLATQAGLRRGDVLFVHNANRQHVAMYCGDGMEVEASINEFGGVTGGEPGDQTGTEFLIQPYRNIWEHVLRYREEVYMFEFENIRYGDKGPTVKLLQALLKGRGYKDRETGKDVKVDSEWGDSTQRCFVYFQEKNRLAIKSECDETRWKKLLYR